MHVRPQGSHIPGGSYTTLSRGLLIKGTIVRHTLRLIWNLNLCRFFTIYQRPSAALRLYLLATSVTFRLGPTGCH